MVMFSMVILLIMLSSSKVDVLIISNKRQIEQVTSCIKEIIVSNFHVDPLGFIVLTKTHNLVPPADEIQDIVFEAFLTNNQTTVMTIGNSTSDDFWKAKNDINDKATRDSVWNVDDSVEVIQDQGGNIIQTHVLFVKETDYYVIIVDGIRTYNSKIRQILKTPSWNPRAPILIYCSKPTYDEERMLLYPKLILQSMWSYHAMNVTLLMHDWKQDSKINIYSWNPYDPPKRCGEKNQDIEKYIELYDVCESGKLVHNTLLFPNKVPKNLMGCTINVLGIIWRPFLNYNESREDAGLDRDVINIIAERLNFTIDLNTEEDEWGDINPNGSWYGMMGDIKKGKGEVAIGAIYPDNEVHKDFDSTDSYLQDSYVWILPRARELPDWENLLIVLTPKMWITSFCVYLVCTVVWYLLCQTYWETGITIKSYTYAMLDSLCMYIGESTISRPNSHSMRIYYCVFCLYGMIWATAYQTKLIDILTTPIYEHQISTVDELLKSDLNYGGNEALKFLFNNSIDETEDELHSNYMDLDIHEALDFVINFRNVSVLTSKLYIQYLTAMSTRYNDYRGSPKFYTLATPAFSFPVEMVTSKGFVFLDRFNAIISLIKSNGILKLFHANFHHRCKKKIGMLIRTGQLPSGDENESITLEHLQGAFMVLALGYITAFVIFLGEIFLQMRKNKLKALHSTNSDKTWKSFFFRKLPNNRTNKDIDVIQRMHITKYYTRHKFLKNIHLLETAGNMRRLKHFEM